MSQSYRLTRRIKGNCPMPEGVVVTHIVVRQPLIAVSRRFGPIPEHRQEWLCHARLGPGYGAKAPPFAHNAKDGAPEKSKAKGQRLGQRGCSFLRSWR